MEKSMMASSWDISMVLVQTNPLYNQKWSYSNFCVNLLGTPAALRNALENFDPKGRTVVPTVNANEAATAAIDGTKIASWRCKIVG